MHDPYLAAKSCRCDYFSIGLASSNEADSAKKTGIRRGTERCASVQIPKRMLKARPKAKVSSQDARVVIERMREARANPF